MASVAKPVPLKFVDGISVPVGFPDDHLRQALQLTPKPEDVGVIAYPKCGTNWTYLIIDVLFTPGLENAENLREAAEKFTFIDMFGTSKLEEIPEESNRFFFTHLTVDTAPLHPQGRYVYVARNPWDCCVSFYYFAKEVTAVDYEDGNWNDFVKCFFQGRLPYGDCMTHIKNGFEHRNDPNLLFITYEEMKRDTAGSIKKIARFLKTGNKTGNDVLTDAEAEFVADATNIDKLKKSGPAKIEGKEVNLFRKGIIGDFKNVFSPEQKTLADEYYKKSCQDAPELFALWADMLG